MTPPSEIFSRTPFEEGEVEATSSDRQLDRWIERTNERRRRSGQKEEGKGEGARRRYLPSLEREEGSLSRFPKENPWGHVCKDIGVRFDKLLATNVLKLFAFCFLGEIPIGQATRQTHYSPNLSFSSFPPFLASSSIPSSSLQIESKGKSELSAQSHRERGGFFSSSPLLLLWCPFTI